MIEELMIFYILFFILGLVIGSFINVLLLRSGKIKGRSICFSCGKQIKWYDLIPVFSFLFLKGRCRFCQSQIQIQYPLVEFISGLISILIYFKYKDLFLINFNLFLEFILFWLIGFVLWFIFLYDLKHKIILDQSIFVFLILAILFRFSIYSFSFSAPFFYDLLAGLLTALPFFIIWGISRGFWMGFGDVKFALPAGIFVGLSFFISALILSFWFGAIYSLLAMVILKFLRKLKFSWTFRYSLNRRSELPFLPFMTVAFFFSIFFKFNLFNYLANLF